MWRETEYEDLQGIVLPADISVMDIRALLPDLEGSRELLRFNARTWWDSGQILAIVGIAPMWKGVGTVWTLLTVSSRQHGVALTRGVLRFLDMLHVDRGYWRLQATTEHTNATARLWIIRLGFEYEGTMTAYGPDARTHDMYARLRF